MSPLCRRLLRGAMALVVPVVVLATTAPAWALLTPGIDTSRYQHNPSLNWQAVSADGVKFAFMKATEGSTWTDPYFAADWQASRAAGLYRGAYHFARPSLGTAFSQARHFASVIGPQNGPGTLPPVLDLEVTGGLGPAQLIDWTRTFLQSLEQLTGRTPIIYVSPGFWQGSMANSTAFGRYPLWIANWGTSSPHVPSGWSRWTFWQTTSSGSVSGISGRVDKDLFNGDLAALRRLALGGAPETTQETAISLTADNPAPMIGQRVRLSGTLRTAGGAPVAGKRVTLYVRPAGGTSTVLTRVSTDSGGQFTARTRSPGAARFRARFAGGPLYKPASDTADIGLTPRPTTVTLDPLPTPVLAGRELTLQGTLTPARRLAGSTVSLWFRPRGSGQWQSVDQAVTDATGAWQRTVTAMGSGAWRAQFTGSAAYTDATSPRSGVTVDPNPTTLTMRSDRLEVYRGRRVTLRGRLLSGQAGVAGQRVTIVAPGTPDDPVASAVTDAEGRFVAPVPVDAPMTLQATTSRTAMYQSASTPSLRVTVKPPEPTLARLSPRSAEDASLRASRPHRLRGRLLTAAGVPVSGRPLELWRRVARTSTWERVQTVRSVEDGRWEFTVTPRKTSIYHVVFAGGSRFARAHTERVRVSVAGR